MKMRRIFAVLERTFPRLAIVLILGVYFGTANADDLYPEINPDPSYEPREVVGIQMRALGHNDVPYENAGIELSFRFASPGNKVNTGPIERFTALFNIPAYRPMINHAELEIGPGTQSDSTAFVPVKIRDQNGKESAYLFQLSKQAEFPFENCWMTDSVVLMQIPSDSSGIM